MAAGKTLLMAAAAEIGAGKGVADLAPALSALVVEAGAAALRARRAGLAARIKPDGSPVTAADEAAEAVILAGLAQLLPEVPVVSEESVAPHVRATSLFMLVDPLDGTRELVAGRDEFTVNVALIDGGVPILGVVAAPALRLLWRGGRDVSPARFVISEEGMLREGDPVAL